MAGLWTQWTRFQSWSGPFSETQGFIRERGGGGGGEGKSLPPFPSLPLPSPFPHFSHFQFPSRLSPLKPWVSEDGSGQCIVFLERHSTIMVRLSTVVLRCINVHQRSREFYDGEGGVTQGWASTPSIPPRGNQNNFRFDQLLGSCEDLTFLYEQKECSAIWNQCCWLESAVTCQMFSAMILTYFLLHAVWTHPPLFWTMLQ